MQYKKITKPLLERKRRARINACLDELKEIMTGCLQTEGENVSKLEKADILELTVRHIQKLNQAGASNPVEDISKFRAGYSSCANEAAHFLISVPGVDVRLGQRLVAHLMTGLQQPPQPQPLQSLLQQRMLSMLGSDQYPGSPLMFPPTQPSPDQQVIPSLSTTSKQSSDLFKPVPVKPSPLRLELKSTSPPPAPSHKLNVWKPYTS